MNLEEHRVLYHMDDPYRILTLTVPEALGGAIPALLGMLLDCFAAGVGVGLVIFGGFRKLGRKRDRVKPWLYWNGLLGASHPVPGWVREVGP